MNKISLLLLLPYNYLKIVNLSLLKKAQGLGDEGVSQLHTKIPKRVQVLLKLHLHGIETLWYANFYIKLDGPGYSKAD